MSLEKSIAAALAKQIKGSVPPSHTPLGSAKEEKITPPAEVLLSDDEVLFSSVFGYEPSFGDFAVKKVIPSSEWGHLVPEANPEYVPQKEEIAILVAGFMDGERTLLNGPTGSGKSTAIEYIAAKLGWPFIRVNMSADIESAALFGSLTAEGGATKWNDGPVAEACKAGAILLIDEWELMPSEIGMGMQRLLEDGGSLVLKEKPGSMSERTYVPHPNFRVVYAGNTTGLGDTTGHYIGTRPQNKATIGRFNSIVTLGYLDKTHEVAILEKKGIKPSTAGKMVDVANLIRSAFDQGSLSLTMSPRTLIAWGKKLQRIPSPKLAFMACYANALPDEEKTGAQILLDKVF